MKKQNYSLFFLHVQKKGGGTDELTNQGMDALSNRDTRMHLKRQKSASKFALIHDIDTLIHEIDSLTFTTHYLCIVRCVFASLYEGMSVCWSVCLSPIFSNMESGGEGEGERVGGGGEEGRGEGGWRGRGRGRGEEGRGGKEKKWEDAFIVGLPNLFHNIMKFYILVLFLDASSHLYKWLCPSVGPSVGPLVIFCHIQPPATRPQLLIFYFLL